MPAALLPARHWSEPGRIDFNPNCSEGRKEGVGETSGQTAGSNFEEGARADRRPVRQKKQVFFVRCGSLEVRNFIRHCFARWDLVLTCSPTPSFPTGAGGVRYFPEKQFPDLFSRGVAAVVRTRLVRALRASRLRPWLSVRESRAVNHFLAARQSPHQPPLFDFVRLRRSARVYTVFIATLKLPFKLDRP
jgi:hypothetical protein